MRKYSSYLLGILSIASIALTSCGNKFSPISPDNKNEVSIISDKLDKFLSAPYSVDNAAKCVKDGEDAYNALSIPFSWKGDPSHVELSKDAGFADKKEIEINTDYFHLSNFEADTTYYWRIKKEEKVSKAISFKTKKTIRTLSISGVSNCRDAGVWKVYNLDGSIKGEIRQGLLYRSGNLDDITYLGKEQLNDLNIKTELDLRALSEVRNPNLFENYINISAPQYAGSDNSILDEDQKETMNNILSTFANEDNYPIIYHCAIGRDRTGTVGFLLGALLGMSLDDLCRDYDLSYYSTDGDLKHAHLNTTFGLLINKMSKYKDENLSLQENVRQYFLDLGLSEEQLDSIENILIKTN